MPLPDILRVQEAARDIVRQAHKQERSLTPRLIRRDVELCFSLEPGSLDLEEYKRAIESAILSLDEEAGGCAEIESSLKMNPKSKQLHKNTKSARKPIHDQRPTVKRRRNDRVKEYKSAAIITSSDVEEKLESTSQEGPLSKGLEDSSMEEHHNKHDYPPYKRRKAAQADGGQIRETESTILQNNVTKGKSTMCTLVDEAPQRRKKPKTIKEPRGKSVQITEGKESTSSKNEATIKRLKSFVVACGVRKVWSRVFENIEVPAQQIKKLREILAELGMTGRLSLEQAKRIKEKRELAKELEDVQSFQQSVVDRASRGRKASRPHKMEIDSDGDTNETDDIPVVPMQRKRTALQSITAFLDDQSDNE